MEHGYEQPDTGTRLSFTEARKIAKELFANQTGTWNIAMRALREKHADVVKDVLSDEPVQSDPITQAWCEVFTIDHQISAKILKFLEDQGQLKAVRGIGEKRAATLSKFIGHIINIEHPESGA